MRSCRRGFTLTEIMLALVVTLVVAGAVYNLLLATQRVTRAQTDRIAIQSALRAGSLIVLNELSELSTAIGDTPDQNDVLAMSPTAITYRAMRGTGFICHVAAPTIIRLAQGAFSGHRLPQAGRDQAYVFVSGHPAPEVKDSWAAAKIVAVTTALPCPAGLGPGITLTLSASPSAELLEPGTPVRITELMELRPYRADDAVWLGARAVSTGEAIQPLVGPLAGSDGFVLEYLDSGGGPTANRGSITTIQVTLRGLLDSQKGGDRAAEELVTLVPLRNSPAS